MKTIKCGLLPGESRALVERANQPLRSYLEQCLGQPVELVVGSSYVATGEALRRGQLDLAYLGPVTYILQSKGAGLEPFARPTHGGSIGPTFKAAIIVPADSPAETLSHLRGTEIGMADLASTSGAWVPRHMLLNSGLVMDRDYTRRVLGAHDAVADAVLNRKVAAGGISMAVLRRLLADGRLDGRSIRVLAESLPIPEYMWVFRQDLSEALKAQIRRAFVQLNDPAVLAPYAAESFIPAVDADVDRVRRWMEDILQARFQSYAEGDYCPQQSTPPMPPPVARGVVLPWRGKVVEHARHRDG